MKRSFVLYVAAAAILVTAAGVFADVQAGRAAAQDNAVPAATSQRSL